MEPTEKNREMEETLALIPQLNAPNNMAKPWFSNREIYVSFGAVLTTTQFTDQIHYPFPAPIFIPGAGRNRG